MTKKLFASALAGGLGLLACNAVLGIEELKEDRSPDGGAATGGGATGGAGGAGAAGTGGAGAAGTGGSAGDGGCVPKSCQELGAECGQATDGCNGWLDCGPCSNPDKPNCGGGGPNKCGSASCTPKTCDELGVKCGSAFDGCGSQLDCGACAGGQKCCSGTCAGCCGDGDCDDTVTCTTNQCTGGSCVYTPDGAKCETGKICDPTAGCINAPACNPAIPVDPKCDDTNLCTTDTCTSAAKCSNTDACGAQSLKCCGPQVGCQGCCGDADCPGDPTLCLKGACSAGSCQKVPICTAPQKCCPGQTGCLQCCDNSECPGDPTNCLAGVCSGGVCQKAPICVGSSPACCGGQCQACCGPCQPGQTQACGGGGPCDGNKVCQLNCQWGSTCEGAKDLNNDMNNCGTCGYVCSLDICIEGHCLNANNCVPSGDTCGPGGCSQACKNCGNPCSDAISAWCKNGPKGSCP